MNNFLYFIVLLLTSQSAVAFECVTDLASMRVFKEPGSLERELVPIGMSGSEFARLQNLVRTHPLFSQVEAVVLFGSRTHFEFGPKPSLESDLDMAAFFPASFSQDEILKQTERINLLLKEMGFTISVKIDFPALASLQETVEELPPISEERLRGLRLIDRIADDGRWDDLLHRNAHMNFLRSDHTWVNPEAIFLNNNAGPRTISTLKSKAYKVIDL